MINEDKVYPAHIRWDANNNACVQTVAEHCRTCAEYAADVSVRGLNNTAYLAGILHDMGKFTAVFRDYIERASVGENVRRGSVNHTFAGVRFVMERWHDPDAESIKNLTCEIIAFAIGSHHGMFDCVSPEGKDGFLHRVTKEMIGYEEARENFLTRCAGFEELDKLFIQAEREIGALCDQCRNLVDNEQTMRFHLSLLARMVLSAVIDGDRRDTANFMMDIPQVGLWRDPTEMWVGCLAALERRISLFPADTPIAKARHVISGQCRDSVRRGNGIYRLAVPTGGGKTLSGLRYGLAAAAENRKKHVFFVIPLLSVLEQNAKVIREFVGDNSLILEHHSNVLREKADCDALDENELLMETWDAPIVITTLVQLLNTLFMGKTSSVRRMQALTDSVIIIDEVQSVPRRMLSLFSLAMNFLCEICNATIVLCSATQPSLERATQPIRYGEPADLVAPSREFWDIFRRTEIIDRRKPGGYTVRELADFGLECLELEGSVLLICNTKAQAREVYGACGSLPGVYMFHLSASMCMAHRIQVLAEINHCLKEKKKVVCVATQLVEAGVDFSFGCVIRISAGLDNIIQAAGRCNRNGEFGSIRPVYVMNIKGENLSRLKEIRQSQQAAESVLLQFEQSPEQLGGNLSSDKAISAYYRRLYTDMAANAQDFPVAEYGTTLYVMLSDNRGFVHHCPTGGRYIINQSFKAAGDAFQVFDENTTDILVPYGEGVSIISDLGSGRVKKDLAYLRKLIGKTKSYSISVYDYEKKKLEASGGLVKLCDGAVLALRSCYYSEEIGLNFDGNIDCFMEV